MVITTTRLYTTTTIKIESTTTSTATIKYKENTDRNKTTTQINGMDGSLNNKLFKVKSIKIESYRTVRSITHHQRCLSLHLLSNQVLLQLQLHSFLVKL